MKEATRIFLLTSGTLCVALGALGMVLPLLPTTPFLLLAAICYGRSSDRFYQRLISNRWFGKYIQNYREGRGIAMRQKVVTILSLWLSILLSVLFLSTPLWTKFLLVGIAAGVSIYLLCVKTMREDASLTDQSI